jgi:hypothetical protein
VDANMFAAVFSSLIIKIQIAILRLEKYKTIYVFVTQNVFWVFGNNSRKKAG